MTPTTTPQAPSVQAEALRLADALDDNTSIRLHRPMVNQAAAELRRLHGELAEFQHAAGVANDTIKELSAQLSRLQAGGARPQNCGTGYCSCIECPYKAAAPALTDAQIEAVFDRHKGTPGRELRVAIGRALLAEAGAAPTLVPLTDIQQRHMAIGHALERAAKELPDGYDLQVCVERGAGWATISCPDLHNIAPTFDGDHTLADQIDGCVHAAIRHDAARNGLTVGGDGGEG